MKVRNTSLWDISTRIPELYGGLIFIGLLAYFFLMYAVGLVHVAELRLLNLLILLTGVYLALRQFRRTHRGYMDYFHAFSTGMATATIGTLAFGAFLMIYLHIDENLMQAIADQPLGMYMDPYIAAFLVTLEGTFSGLFVTFLLSNYMAARTPVTPARREKDGEIIK